MSHSDLITFHIDRAKVPEDQMEDVRAVLRTWAARGYLSWDKPEEAKKKKAATKKTVPKGKYPEWFEKLWAQLPVKVGKPDTLKACEEVFKVGYTVEDIERGIPGYAKDEKRRSKAPDYQKHAPHRWIKNHRFLDAQDHSPDKALKTGTEIMIEPLEKALNYRIHSHDLVTLLQILDEVTVEQLLERTNTYPEYESFLDWLRATYMEIV